MAEGLDPSVHVCSAWHQQLPGPAAYTRNRMQRTGKYNSSRLDVTNTLWAGMLYPILIVPSMKIIGKFREIEKKLTEFIFFEKTFEETVCFFEGGQKGINEFPQNVQNNEAQGKNTLGYSPILLG